MNSEHRELLLQAYRDDSLTPTQAEELGESLHRGQGLDDLLWMRRIATALDPTDADAIWRGIATRIDAARPPLRLDLPSRRLRAVRRRRRHAPVALAAVLLLGLGAVTLYALRTPGPAGLRLVAGRARTEHRALAPGDVLPPGAQVRVGPAPLLLAALDGARFELAPGSRARCAPTRIELIAGQLDATLPRRDHTTRLQTPLAAVEVPGTGAASAAMLPLPRLAPAAPSLDTTRLRLAAGKQVGRCWVDVGTARLALVYDDRSWRLRADESMAVHRHHETTTVLPPRNSERDLAIWDLTARLRPVLPPVAGTAAMPPLLLDPRATTATQGGLLVDGRHTACVDDPANALHNAIRRAGSVHFQAWIIPHRPLQGYHRLPVLFFSVDTPAGRRQLVANLEVERIRWHRPCLLVLNFAADGTVSLFTIQEPGSVVPATRMPRFDAAPAHWSGGLRLCAALQVLDDGEADPEAAPDAGALSAAFRLHPDLPPAACWRLTLLELSVGLGTRNADEVAARHAAEHRYWASFVAR